MTGESMRDVFLVVLCALSLIGGSVDAGVVDGLLDCFLS